MWIVVELILEMLKRVPNQCGVMVRPSLEIVEIVWRWASTKIPKKEVHDHFPHPNKTNKEDPNKSPKQTLIHLPHHTTNFLTSRPNSIPK